MMNFIEPPQNNIPSMDQWNRRRAMMGRPILGGNAYQGQQAPIMPQTPSPEMPITTSPGVMRELPQNQLGIMPPQPMPIYQPPVNTMQPLPKKKPMYGMGYGGPILNNMAVNNGR